MIGNDCAVVNVRKVEDSRMLMGWCMADDSKSQRVGATKVTVLACLAGVAGLLVGCADPEYDTSTPERTVDAVRQMVEDGRADLIPTLLYIEPRELTFHDGVTEASAIDNVMEKLGDMLGRLQRVSTKLAERYPDQVAGEAEFARTSLFGGQFERFFSEFLADPFGFLDAQRTRIDVIDLGDGTAAVLFDGEPAFGGLGLQMRELSGGWRFELPIDMAPISTFRPDTREEWAVLAYMMLAFENSLKDFERKLDRGEFRDLGHAAGHAGRLLGESAIVQGAIYAYMKQSVRSDRAGR